MLELKNITKDYITGENVVHALKGISVTLRDNEFVAILGPSGCGKTTTLNIVGGLDRYTSGDLLIEGKSTKEYKDKDWDAFRNHKVGFVFQSYNLIPHQTVLSNVEMALTIGNVPKEKREQMAKDALTKVGLKDEIHKFPMQMSGGQMQRVAIARAIVNTPAVLLADEPTGALDSKTSMQVMDLLKELSKECLVVMVTHNTNLADKYATRIIKLSDGEMIDDSNPYDPTTLDIEEAKIKDTEKNKKYLDKKGKMKKVGMPFLTALKLSLANLKSKKARTILTCFAGSIGIIGIALVLSVSNGFNNYVSDVESSTLSRYPVTIENSSFDITTLFTAFMNTNDKTTDKTDHATDTIYPNFVMVDLLKTMASSAQYNDLSSFKTYLEANYDQISEYVDYVSYGYDFTLNIYTNADDGSVNYKQCLPFDLPDDLAIGSYNSTFMEEFMSNYNIWDQMYNDNEILKNQYDLVYGSWAEDANEVVLVVNGNGEISDFALYSLGFVENGDDYVRYLINSINNGETIPDDYFKNKGLEWNYSDIVYDGEGDTKYQNYYVIPSSSFYIKDETSIYGFDTFSKYDAQYILDNTSDSTINLKIVGIVSENPNSDTHSINGVIGYTKALSDEVIAINNKSDVVKTQKENPTNFVSPLTYNGVEVNLKGETYEAARTYLSSYENLLTDEYLYNLMMTSYGYVDTASPSSISIYPKSFEDKDGIITFIDNYNKQWTSTSDTSDDFKIISYNDYISTIMGSVSTIINAITYVLVAFVSISLVVSSIMIAIITYISVLERTKEIGILRAMGASKSDVKNIFNAETFITGLISGVLGVAISVVLDIPISLLVNHLAGIEHIAVLPWEGGVILVIISFFLSIISGLIPSSFAAKCDPVVALRSD